MQCGMLEADGGSEEGGDGSVVGEDSGGEMARLAGGGLRVGGGFGGQQPRL